MKKELELYLHIPFCVQKCAYCDFLSFGRKDRAGGDTAKLYDRYFASLKGEIEAFPWTEQYEVSSVFIGGGTPSAVPAKNIAALIETLYETFDFQKNAEISIEANPGTLSLKKLQIYRNAGINRISLGLQSVHNEELRLLGRIHTWEDFLDSWEMVEEAGFRNRNIDLMSALPGQTAASWEEGLLRVLKLRPEHISAYSLIIEEGTPFYEKYGEAAGLRAKGEESGLLPDEETERQMYHRTKQILEEHGYHRYEISNYARKGYECRHNCGYWQRKEYRGFGLGAASLMKESRSANTEELEEYLKGSYRMEVPDRLTTSEQMEETMFLGLRLTRGVSTVEFEKRFGRSTEEIYGKVIEDLQREGLLEKCEEFLRLTEKGMDLANYAMSKFLL
ncbi:MAG: radical SAM family heme chaperone HemW [Eubacteriales bacterium]|nr:radical SAM family heme chaperone HemW [Eubacteriales bacterium]